MQFFLSSLDFDISHTRWLFDVWLWRFFLWVLTEATFTSANHHPTTSNYNDLSCFKIFYHTQLYFPKLIFNTLLLFLEPKDKEKRSWINATLGLNNFGLPWSPGGAPWQPDLSPPSTSHPPQLYPSSPSLETLSASLSRTTILRCKMTNMVDMKVDESGCTFEEELQAKDELRCTI